MSFVRGLDPHPAQPPAAGFLFLRSRHRKLDEDVLLGGAVGVNVVLITEVLCGHETSPRSHGSFMGGGRTGSQNYCMTPFTQNGGAESQGLDVTVTPISRPNH